MLIIRLKSSVCSKATLKPNLTSSAIKYCLSGWDCAAEAPVRRLFQSVSYAWCLGKRVTVDSHPKINVWDATPCGQGSLAEYIGQMFRVFMICSVLERNFLPGRSHENGSRKARGV